MKTFLVTGGAGFIGSHLTNRLAKKGHRVIVIDNLERGDRDNIIPSEHVHFIEEDLRKYKKVQHLFKSVDVVVHMASKVGSIGTYTSKPYEVMSANMQIDANVLRAVVKHKVPKYFYASSAHVYPLPMQMSVDSEKLYERYASGGCGLSYGWAKLIGEKQARYAEYEHSFLKVAIARFVGIYGPNQDYSLENGSVIPVFSHRAVRYPEIPFTVWGDGSETRSYCYIHDALDCVELMIEDIDVAVETGPLNVGSGERYSISEIAESIVTISGKDINIEYEKDKVAVIKGQLCSVELVKRWFDWESTTTLVDGLSKVYNDIKQRIEKQ